MDLLCLLLNANSGVKITTQLLCQLIHVSLFLAVFLNLHGALKDLSSLFWFSFTRMLQI